MKFLDKLPAAFAALAMGNALYGASMDERVAALEKQMKCVYMDSPIETCGSTTAIATPAPTNCCGWFFSLDALLWEAHVGGTEFAWRINQPSVSSVPSFPMKGGTKEVEFGWDWGVRAGIGYAFEYDGWDVFAEFTYFNTDAHATSSAGHNAAVIPLKGASTIVAGGPFEDNYYFCSTAKANVDVVFRRLDVELGRDYYVSPKLSLRPNFGIVAAWINLKEEVRYFGGEGEFSLGINTVHVKDKDYFKGAGPKIGVNSDWYLGAGFSLYANANASLVYGLHDVEHNERFSAIAVNTLELESSRHRYVPNAMLQSGICWKGYIDENDKHLTISFGFDGQYWWRLNQMIDIDQSSPINYGFFSEDVGFIGMNLSVRLAL